jgi:hypothetical protein
MATYYYEIDLNDNGNQKPLITKHPSSNLMNEDVAIINIDDSTKKNGEESVVILNTERMYKFFI